MVKITSRENQSPALVPLFDDLARDGINLDIYEHDEMFLVFYWAQGASRDPAVAMYLASGRAIWQTLRAVLLWRFGSLENVSRLLDFASGFGRVTRFMVGELPPERIWVTDLQAEALAAQAKEFGVRTLLSTEDPAELELPGTFDAVVVSSLFSHLPPHRFVEWMGKLGAAVAPGGVFILSVHGAELLDRPPATIEFRPDSESQRLPGSSYGSSWVSEAFVRDTVRAALGGSWQVMRFARGMLSMQDLYVLVPDHAADPAALELPRQIDGFVERFELDSTNRLFVAGWLADRQLRQKVAGVILRLGGHTVADLDVRSMAARADIQAVLGDPAVPVWGYALEMPLDAGWNPSAQVELACRFGDGGEAPLLRGTLEWALLRGARVAAMYAQSHAREREAELQREKESLALAGRRIAELQRDLAMAGEAAAALEARIRWMQASRFWRLRDRWFDLRRRLRL